MLENANKVLELKNKIKDPNYKDSSGNSKGNKMQAIAEEEKIISDKDMLSFLQNKMKEMETEYDLVDHLVIDLGHAYCKFGVSGEDLPRLIVPSVYAKLKREVLDKKTADFSFEIK